MKKIFIVNIKPVQRGLTLTGIALSFMLINYSCKTARQEVNVQPESNQAASNNNPVVQEGGLGSVPFHARGRLDFSAKVALKRMKKRKEQERRVLEKQKKEFRAMADERAKGGGLALSYWIAPPEYPEETAALLGFPRDKFGYPDWVAAVKKGIIHPQGTLPGSKEEDEGEDEEEDDEELFNQDILFVINDRIMANVRFPHSVHNYWLSCKVCHPGIFIAKKGANQVAMNKIWGGKFCGRCHGAVAFLPKGFENCIRCHSVRRKKVKMNY